MVAAGVTNAWGCTCNLRGLYLCRLWPYGPMFPYDRRHMALRHARPYSNRGCVASSFLMRVFSAALARAGMRSEGTVDIANSGCMRPYLSGVKVT